MATEVRFTNCEYQNLDDFMKFYTHENDEIHLTFDYCIAVIGSNWQLKILQVKREW